MAYGFNADKSKFDIVDIEKEIAGLVNVIYPVGSIYLSTRDVNPASFFGGTWVAWGAGRVPVGVDTSDSNFSTVEKTGGAAAQALTTAQLPGHTHTYNAPKTPTGSTTAGVNTATVMSSSDKTDLKDWATYVKNALSTLKSKTGASFTIPTLSMSVMGATVATSEKAHTHTVTTESKNSGSNGSGSAHNNLQPYITCYMWKRTA